MHKHFEMKEKYLVVKLNRGFWSINELGEREKRRERRGEAVMFDVGM